MCKYELRPSSVRYGNLREIGGKGKKNHVHKLLGKLHSNCILDTSFRVSILRRINITSFRIFIYAFSSDYFHCFLRIADISTLHRTLQRTKNPHCNSHLASIVIILSLYHFKNIRVICAITSYYRRYICIALPLILCT